MSWLYIAIEINRTKPMFVIDVHICVWNWTLFKILPISIFVTDPLSSTTLMRRCNTRKSIHICLCPVWYCHENNSYRLQRHLNATPGKGKVMYFLRGVLRCPLICKHDISILSFSRIWQTLYIINKAQWRSVGWEKYPSLIILYPKHMIIVKPRV